MANTPKPIAKGAVKFKSIKDAAAAAGVPYMTFYMRMRNGQTASQAYARKVRKYEKRAMPEHDNFKITPMDIFASA